MIVQSVSARVDHRSRLALAEKLHQRSLSLEVGKVREGKSLAAPTVVELDVTTFCDLACPECISGSLLNRGRFSNERLLELAAEICEVGVRAVILIGGGEPLLHPVVADVIEAFAEANVAVGLTTNGTQLNRHHDVVARYVEWTRVSVDAASAATYNLFRPRRGGTRDTFAEVVENVRSLARDRRGSLGYSFLLIARRARRGKTILHHNFDEVAAAAHLARDIGCDYIEFKPEYDLNHRLVAQPRELRELLIDELAAAADIQCEAFNVIAPAHLDKVIADERLDEPKTYHHCPTVELRTLLTPSGAYLCPYHRGNASARYGDPSTEGFREMWTSNARLAAAKRVNPSRDCSFSCIRHQSNQWLIDGEPTRNVDDYDMFI